MIKKKVLDIFKDTCFLLVQSCGQIVASLLSTASQKLSGHVLKSGEQVEYFSDKPGMTVENHYQMMNSSRCLISFALC